MGIPIQVHITNRNYLNTDHIQSKHFSVIDKICISTISILLQLQCLPCGNTDEVYGGK